jgi:hypothetical protein
MSKAHDYFLKAADVWTAYFEERIGGLERDRRLDILYLTAFGRKR